MKNLFYKKTALKIIGAIGLFSLIFSFSTISTEKNIKTKYKDSTVSYFGSKKVTEGDLIKEAKLIDIADRRFETKWVNKDPKGISEEYTTIGAVFMKPGVKPKLGRYVILWKKENGKWLIQYDMFNADK